MGILDYVIGLKAEERKEKERIDASISNSAKGIREAGKNSADAKTKNNKLEQDKTNTKISLAKSGQILDEDGNVSFTPQQQAIVDGNAAAGQSKILQTEIEGKIASGLELSDGEREYGVGKGLIDSAGKMTQSNIANLSSKAVSASISGNPEMQFQVQENPKLRNDMYDKEVIRLSNLHGVELPPGLQQNVLLPPNSPTAAALPNGVTEEDIQTTMIANNITREVVMQRLGA